MAFSGQFRSAGIWLPEAVSLAEHQPCTVSVTVDALVQNAKNAVLRCVITDAEGRAVATCCQALANGLQGLQLTIADARLWWCNGMGQAYLYTVTVTAEDASGAVLDRFTQRLGLRTIALEEPDLGENGSGFVFLLNGVPVFCKGANHVPCDCLPGRVTTEKERQLVRLARDEHMNMLRV